MLPVYAAAGLLRSGPLSDQVETQRRSELGAGVSSEGQSAQPVIYLMGQSVLDRLAYKQLLAHELQREVAVDSDFRPTSVWAAMRSKPNLVLVDSDAPHPDVVDAVQMVSRLCPDIAIIVVSAAVEPTQVESWSHCPLHGYVVKDGGLEELRAAINAVLASREYFSAGIREALVRAARHTHSPPRLSRRESELLPLLARGLSLREAARQMTISYKTADSYRTTLLRKLGLRDRVELARYAIRARIIDP
jgi:DNA-binding NarL/FixJ family response regulator